LNAFASAERTRTRGIAIHGDTRGFKLKFRFVKAFRNINKERDKGIEKSINNAKGDPPPWTAHSSI